MTFPRMSPCFSATEEQEVFCKSIVNVEQFGDTGPQYHLEEVDEAAIVNPAKWLGIDHDHSYNTKTVHVNEHCHTLPLKR